MKIARHTLIRSMRQSGRYPSSSNNTRLIIFAVRSFRLGVFLGRSGWFLDCLLRQSEGPRLVGFDRTLLPSSQSGGLDIPLLLKLLQDTRDGFLSSVEYPCNLIGIGSSAVPDPAGPYHFLH